MDLIDLYTGWWFGTWMDYDFPIILGMSSSQLTNSIIFQGGRSTTNQITKHQCGVQVILTEFDLQHTHCLRGFSGGIISLRATYWGTVSELGNMGPRSPRAMNSICAWVCRCFCLYLWYLIDMPDMQWYASFIWDLQVYLSKCHRWFHEGQPAIHRCILYVNPFVFFGVSLSVSLSSIDRSI